MNFNTAEFLTSYGLLEQIPPSEQVEIAFSGRSNVGKSSLINKLLNRKSLARVSAMPGKTITINFYKVDESRFVDLPGYGYAKVAKTEKQRWSELIEGYFNDDRNLGLVVQLVDIRHAPTKLDIDMINYLITIEMPFIVVLTKSDKLTKNQQAKRVEELKKEIPYGEEVTMLAVSSEKGDGIQELKNIITEVCED
ncbi:MAG: ribosome biosis GTP-binding protein YsxC/EngB [Oscillospiraceae bacterium]|nr:ribosome biosis GTP-binding protein YsxC/EngB [Oscillospiraceae bacterium]